MSLFGALIIIPFFGDLKYLATPFRFPLLSTVLGLSFFQGNIPPEVSLPYLNAVPIRLAYFSVILGCVSMYKYCLSISISHRLMSSGWDQKWWHLSNIRCH
eukprot:901029_1